VEKILGIRSKCQVKKNSLDDGYRSCSISIVFGFGIDDLRENLIYLKEVLNQKAYWVGDDVKPILSIEKAISYCYEKKIEDEIRQKTISVWHEIEDRFSSDRKKTVR
jgi:hypothetical protein